MTKKEDKKVQNYCSRTHIKTTKNGAPFVVKVDCGRNLENNGMIKRRREECCDVSVGKCIPMTKFSMVEELGGRRLTMRLDPENSTYWKHTWD